MAETISIDSNTFFVAPAGDDTHPGSFELPWRTPEHAAQVLQAGQSVYLFGGVYPLTRMVYFAHSGSPQMPICMHAYPGEYPILDASAVQPVEWNRPGPYRREQGAVHIENKAWITVSGLHIRDSHWAGICVMDSQHIELRKNTLDGSYSSGISGWDTTRRGACHHINITENIVTRATIWDLLPAGHERGHEPPHEAISIAGPHHFEVAHNHVYDCFKEGIDVKETSSHGVVHHNLVHHVERQGLYADAWFGVLEDVEFSDNIVHHCGGAGFALSVEDVEVIQDLNVHHNLLYENGCGIYISRWGQDGPRRAVAIHHNTVYHNGYLRPNPGDTYWYMVGGLYFFTTAISDIEIYGNIFSQNRGFEIGYSQTWVNANPDVQRLFSEKNIRVYDNLIDPAPNPPEYPINFGWTGYYEDAYPFENGENKFGKPCFANPSAGDFTPLTPGLKAGHTFPK